MSQAVNSNLEQYLTPKNIRRHMAKKLSSHLTDHEAAIETMAAACAVFGTVATLAVLLDSLVVVGALLGLMALGGWFLAFLGGVRLVAHIRVGLKRITNTLSGEGKKIAPLTLLAAEAGAGLSSSIGMRHYDMELLSKATALDRWYLATQTSLADLPVAAWVALADDPCYSVVRAVAKQRDWMTAPIADVLSRRLKQSDLVKFVRGHNFVFSASVAEQLLGSSNPEISWRALYSILSHQEHYSEILANLDYSTWDYDNFTLALAGGDPNRKYTGDWVEAASCHEDARCRRLAASQPYLAKRQITQLAEDSDAIVRDNLEAQYPQLVDQVAAAGIN